ncbi:MBG domain-containing protein [Pedobacter insulae]|uniref:Gliding motility-associated C-terminal domain-containing protein n=1 Tax=Pedobacter insulae TaxID=414048 RepID=A0A1I2ZGH1_9SPHI|nr:MBG domain-containing protein [Pedobacter insulae]SFH36913.1 gliding motility-associated C-terminal domain-containing protein [Pedobacter insulae]
MKKLLLYLLLFASLKTIGQTITPTSGIVYVKQNGAGTKTGSSWANAAPELADALKAAKTNSAITQIWVAGGTYKPKYSPFNSNFGTPAGQRNSFLMVDNVNLYGGFAGNETSLAQRDLSNTANISTLSGDLDNSNSKTENDAYNVVISSKTISPFQTTTEINGFTIVFGNGGSDDSFEFINYTFINPNYGGGIHINGSQIALVNLTLKNNSAQFGGGIYLGQCTAIIKNVLIAGNTAVLGAGIFNDNFSNLTITNSTISGNRASQRGGGIYSSNANLRLYNTIVYGNNNGIYTTGYLQATEYQYSLVQENPSGTAMVNYTDNANKIFLDPLAPGLNTGGDYTLKQGSPTINSGSNALYTVNLNTDKDLAGNPRLYNNGIIDMGAYELQQEVAQTITVSNVTKTYGDIAFEPGATVDSGQPLTYSSADNSIAEAYQDNADGNKWKINIKKAGTVNITVNASTATGFATETKDFTLTINPKPLTASIKPSAVFNKNYNGNTQGTIAITDLSLATSYVINSDDVQLALSSNVINYDSKDAGTGKTITLALGNLSLTGANATNYTIANPTALTTNNGVINAIPLTLTANNATKVYDGQAYSGGNGVQGTGFVNSESVGDLTGTLTYVGTAQGAINTGTYTIIPSGLSSNNYNISYVNGQLTINLNNVNTLTFNTLAAGATVNRTYGDASINASAVASSGLQASYSSSNANVAAVDNTGQVNIIGTGTTDIIVNQSGNSNYGVATSIKITLNVAKKSLTVKANDATKTFDNIAFQGGNGVSYAGFINGENASNLTGTLSFSGTSQGAINTGTYAIIPSGLSSNNYSFDYQSGILNIVASGANTLTFTSQVSGGNVIKTYGSGVLDASATASSGLTVSYNSNNTTVATVSSAGQINIQSAGTAIITAIQPGNQNINAATPISFTLTVNKANLSITANNDNKVYDGIGYAGGNNVTYTGFVNGENASNLTGTLSYSGSAQGAKNVNSYFITPSGFSSNNYNITYQDGSLSITKAALTITANNANKLYNGQAYSGGNGILSTGFVNSETVSDLTGTLIYAGTAQGAINTGTYTIVPSGFSSNNYNITYVNGQLIVNKSNSNALSFSNQTAGSTLNKTYGDALIDASAVASSGLAVAYSSSNTAVAMVSTSGQVTIKGPGTTDIVATQNGDTNYWAATPIKFTIVVSKKNLIVKANDATKTYDNLAYQGGNGVSYSGFITGESTTNLTGTLSYSGTSQGALNSGTYTIIPSGLASNNYNLTYQNGNLNILPSSANTLTFNSQVVGINVYKTYGDTNVNASATASTGLPVSYTSSNTMVAGVDSNGQVSIRSVGTTTITALQAGNGNFNAATPISFNLIVEKANLTITANSDHKVYDGLIYTGGNEVSYSGFVYSDNKNVLSGTLKYTGSSQGAKKVNSYTIHPSGLSSGNYNIAFKEGALIITKKDINVNVDADQHKLFGTVDPVFTYTVTPALLSGDSFTGSLSREVGENVGNYSINQGSLSAGSNYHISYTGAIFKIMNAPITGISFNSQSFGYDGTAKGLAISGNLPAGTSVVYSNNSLTNVGSQIVTASISGGNYAPLTLSATLSITKANLIVSATNASICQGASLPSFNISYAGFKGADNENSLNSKASASVNTTGSTVGTYLITLAGAASNNYNIAYINGSLTVNALPALQLTSSMGTSISKGDAAILTATGGGSYVWANENGVISGQNTATLTIRPSQTTIYTVTTSNSSGCSTSKSITITVTEDFKIIATNVLSPNGDGINDVWKVENIDLYPNNEVKVFDKGGRVVYQKRGYDNSWNGMLNGTPLSENTYYYIVDFGNGQRVFKGFITIVRD